MLRSVLPLVALPILLVAPLLAQTAQPDAKAGSRADKPPVVVNLNTATVADLEQLPGVGAKTAARIIEYRQKRGPFKKIEELMNVQGIGEKSFLKLKPQISVGTNAPAQP
jgi:competence protein ComEA